MFDAFGSDDDSPEEARERLLDRLQAAGRIERPATIDAMRAVPRHEFVPPDRLSAAYADRPLPIGEGQTISAPHMVGIMTDLLAPEPGERFLEIGTGCGYHAAVTAEIVGPGNLYSVEYSPELAADARETLRRLGYDVSIRVGDGRKGWPEHAPYDAAYLTCAPESIPEPIVAQVRDGGRIVAPVGTRSQQLVRVTVGPDGVDRRETHGGVRFVTMQ